jgi:hypothetical protein
LSYDHSIISKTSNGKGFYSVAHVESSLFDLKSMTFKESSISKSVSKSIMGPFFNIAIIEVDGVNDSTYFERYGKLLSCGGHLFDCPRMRRQTKEKNKSDDFFGKQLDKFPNLTFQGDAPDGVMSDKMYEAVVTMGGVFDMCKETDLERAIEQDFNRPLFQ